MAKKVVLGFSGGLDTSFAAVYLRKELNLEVHSVYINTGGLNNEELDQLSKKAFELGVKSHLNIDAKNDFYNKIIKYLIFGNVLKNHNYPLSVSSERLIQAEAISAYADEIDSEYIAHGSTGAGNDQIRFDTVFKIKNPLREVLTPIRDLKISRKQEVEYLQNEGFEYPIEGSKYSINKGIWGTSIGGKETLNSREYLNKEAWTSPVYKTEPINIQIDFEKGEAIALNNKTYKSKVELIENLEDLVKGYGIGRDIHVGDTIIGIKGRVAFEAAAAVLLIQAHRHLEKHVLSKNQILIKDQLAINYGNLIHEGNFYDPARKNIEMFLESSQEFVSGSVFIKINPNYFYIEGIESPFDLMKSEFGKYGEENSAWNSSDAKGFIKIYSNANTIINQIQNGKN